MDKPILADYLIIGGGIAGVTAAEEIRARDSHGRIIIVAKEEEPLYSRVLLPHYVRGSIAREKIFLRNFDDYARARIDLFSAESVASVHIERKEVVTSLGRTIGYRKLLIASGSEPAHWDTGNAYPDKILSFGTLKDADHARDLMRAQGKDHAEEALIIGGDVVGLECIASARAYDFRTRVLLEKDRYFAGQLEDQGWELIQKYFARAGVEIYPEIEVRTLAPQGDVALAYTTSAGWGATCAWIAPDCGLKRDMMPFSNTGLEVKTGVVVNQFLETNSEHVWAAGDIAEFYDPLYGEHRLLSNWTSAVFQGKLAGMNMTQSDTSPKWSPNIVSSFSITVLGMHLTFVGKTNSTAGVECIVRTWPEEDGYECLYMRNGILEGCLLINHFQDKAAIARVIEMKLDLSSVRDDLKDPYVDIRTIFQK